MQSNFSEYSHYIPYQPAFEKNINYHNFVIPNTHPLFGVVSDFYQFDSINKLDKKISVIPDGCIDFLFIYTKAGVIKTLEGFYREKIIVPLDIEGCAFGVRFFPGALTNILRIHTADLIGKRIPLMDLLKEDYELDKMDEAKDFNKRIELMTNYLLKKSKKVYTSTEIVNYCTKKIIFSEGNVSISDLARDTSYTIRYLRELFHKHVGISPKELCEIIKFQNSFFNLSKFNKDNTDLSLSNFAIQSGYYDQSHMNKSYKKLAGCLPKNLYIEMFPAENY
ncbi:AraC family transcriptional regulator [Clostridium sp. 19966]|uniref:helix-turn-helix domain-containing protein n=1 Tax=Clostridium sp. 19966 TaxID=2768166 RepID=UPI0028DFF948|nr:helix-turn-helix domain-containing protein [Clostridium sp. 19966]MDT8718766.1 AraC family transcriptional regulator [Clostridium sp. 19966]